MGEEIGSLKISAGIDMSRIKEGFKNLKTHFDNTKSRAKSFSSDLSRMADAAGSVAKKFGILGSIGLGTIIGFAKDAPAVAGAMANIRVQTERLKRELGQTFQSEFNRAASIYKDFVDFVDQHPDIVKGFALSAAALAGVAALTGLVAIMSAPEFLTALGLLAGMGALFAAFKGADWIIDNTRDFLDENVHNPIKDYKEGIPGSLEALASVDRSAAEIAAEGFQPTPGGAIHADTDRERDWKFSLLSWLDRVLT